MIALLALPVRGAIAGSFNSYAAISPVQIRDGIGASSSNVVAGWLTDIGDHGLAYWVHGGVAGPCARSGE